MAWMSGTGFGDVRFLILSPLLRGDCLFRRRLDIFDDSNLRASFRSKHAMSAGLGEISLKRGEYLTGILTG